MMKIEEALKEYNEKVEKELSKRLKRKPTCAERYADTTSRQCAFNAGARWAVNELLKDLWHPASEEPRKDVSIIVETHNDENMFYYAWNRWQDNFYPSWTDAVLCSRVSRWLYIEDLFPKEGGENG